ncbi:MAG: hypothetical protein AAB368_15055, partial [bacterium]
ADRREELQTRWREIIDAIAFDVNGTILEAGAGAHAVFAGARIWPQVQAGAATVTDLIGVWVPAITAAGGTTTVSGIKIDPPTGASNNYALWLTGGSFRFDGVGPHAVGAAPIDQYQLLLAGSFTSGVGQANVSGLSVQTALAAAADSGNILGVRIDPTLVERGAGTHAILSGLYVAPAITAGGAATTVAAGGYFGTFVAAGGTTSAAGVYIASAPTGATTNYALWVAAGQSQFDALTVIGGTNNLVFRDNAATGGRLYSPGAGRFAITAGSNDTIEIINNAITVEWARFVPGALGIGTVTFTNITTSTPSLVLGATTFAALPAAPNGTLLYCSNCDPPTLVVNVCTSVGAATGAFAVRINGAWNCIG